MVLIIYYSNTQNINDAKPFGECGTEYKVRGGIIINFLGNLA